MTRGGKACTLAAVLYPFVVAAVLAADFTGFWLAFLPITAGVLFCFRPGFRPLAAVGVLLGVWMLMSGQTQSVLWYPVWMNTLVAAVFAVSLKQTPLIAVFAAQMGVELDDKGRRYAKRLTLIWALFMSTLALMALATVFGPLWLWTVFNGGVSYGLIGLLMAGELIVRRRVMCRMN